MDGMDLLIDLHFSGDRQGPGSAAMTRQALALAGFGPGDAPAILDIGCGSGAQTLDLAEATSGSITAVDLFPQFLEKLQKDAAARGCAGRITTLACSMDSLDFPAGSFDLVWSEGAVYNIGFANGLQSWRPLLRDGGVIALSELSWKTAVRPKEVEDHWLAEYPGVDTVSAKLAAVEAAGYAPLGFFMLPDACWLDNYYRPLETRFAAFLASHAGDPEAAAVVAGEQREIAVFEKYSDYFGYGFYIARKVGAG
jgi:SAM-dependent methyltransferase